MFLKHFAIGRFPAYGRLSRLDTRELLGGASGRTSDDEYAKEDAKTDPHSPGKCRVNGVLVNMLAFREAFACKVGTPMARARVNRVW